MMSPSSRSFSPGVDNGSRATPSRANNMRLAFCLLQYDLIRCRSWVVLLILNSSSGNACVASRTLIRIILDWQIGTGGNCKSLVCTAICSFNVRSVHAFFVAAFLVSFMASAAFMLAQGVERNRGFFSIVFIIVFIRHAASWMRTNVAGVYPRNWSKRMAFIYNTYLVMLKYVAAQYHANDENALEEIH